MKITKGEWRYESGAVMSDSGCVATRTNTALPNTGGHERMTPTEKDANLRLCAASKDLLAALLGMLESAGPAQNGMQMQALVNARVAVAKACRDDYEYKKLLENGVDGDDC